MKPVPLWPAARFRSPRRARYLARAGTRPRAVLLLASGSFALAACGGAGGSGVSTLSAAPPPTAPTPAPSIDYNSAEYRRSPAASSSAAITAWQAGATGKDVTIAIVDSGIDTDSPEFQGRISGASRDVAGLGRSIDDSSGHGTAVAAVAAAARNDREIMGVAFEATIASFKADNGSCSDRCNYADAAIAAGIDAAISARARVVNISLGGSAAYAVLRNAFARASSQGVVLVVSAGNDSAANPDPLAIGALNAAGPSAVLIVGSVGTGGTISDFSNRAGSAASNYLVTLGEDVRSFDHEGQAYYYSGTSFAAPTVSGAVALLAQAFPNLTGARITELLLTTADDLGAPGTDPVYGRGRLNIGRAMAPVGQTSLAGTTMPVASTVSGSLGSALGSGLSTSSGLAAVPVLDSFDRLYQFNLGGQFRAASPARLAGRLEASRLDTAATDLTRGPLKAALTLRATSFRDAPATDNFRDTGGQTAHLGFAQRGLDPRAASRNPLRETRLSLRAGALGFNLASGRLAREALPGSAAGGFAADDGLTPDDNMGTHGRQLMMADWQSGGLTLAVAATHRRLALSRMDGLSTDNRQDQLLAAASWKRGPLALTLQAADTQDSGAFLGTRLSPGFGLEGGRTQSLGAALDLATHGFTLRLAGSRGRATPRFAANSLLQANGALAVQSWSARAQAPLAGGLFSLQVAQPVAVTSGGFQLANGTPVAAHVTARETAHELGWQSGGLSLAAFHRQNAGNQPGLADSGAAFTFRTDF